MSERPVVLLTGAAGALGARLLPLLQERGWHVRCLLHSRSAPGADETVTADLATGAGLDRAVDAVQAVANLAGVTHARSPRRYLAVNARGAGALAAAAQRHGVERFLQVSSRAIDPAGGAYSRSKLEGERLVAGSRVPFVTVRLPEVFGAGGREGVDAIIESARSGRAIPIVGNGRDELRPVPAADALGALARALDAAGVEGNTYTLAGERTSVRELADACIAAFGSSSRIVPVPLAAVAALARLARVLPLPFYPDQLQRLRSPKPPLSPAARSELGFQPPPLAVALAEIAARGH